MRIYHLVWRSDWETQVQGGKYRPPSLATEGFIHATKEVEKLVEVASLFFPPRGDDELLVLTLDESRVGAPIKYEDPGVGHLFPHIYGPLDTASVQKTDTLNHSDGAWHLPTFPRLPPCPSGD